MAVACRLAAPLGARIYAPYSLPGSEHASCENIRRFSRLRDSLRECFHAHSCHIFITAAGIAIRCIASLLQSKARDPAVLVIDQRGRFVISLLSGHLGGGNEMTARAAGILGATPVVTTATDVEGLPALDVLAREKGLAIANLDAVKGVSAALLAGRKVALHDPCNFLGIRGSRWEELFRSAPDKLRHFIGFPGVSEGEPLASTGKQHAAVTDDVPAAEVIVTEREFFRHPAEPDAHAGISSNRLVLHPPLLAAGVGCRKNTPAGEILRHIGETFLAAGLSLASLSCLASIEAKRHEAGLLEAAKSLGVPPRFFPASGLSTYPVSRPSPKAREVFGVNGVCEPAALAAAGAGASLVIPKTASGGVTLAVARIAADKDDRGKEENPF